MHIKLKCLGLYAQQQNLEITFAMAIAKHLTLLAILHLLQGVSLSSFVLVPPNLVNPMALGLFHLIFIQ